HWQAALNAMPANANAQTMTVTGDGKTMTFEDVLIGEVWICSGQSNMEMEVFKARDPQKEMQAATDTSIRLCKLYRNSSDTPLEDVAKLRQWMECSPRNVKLFSAVGYYFGRELRQKLNVPIGLISSSWGGTPAESWTSMPTLKADSRFQYRFDNWESGLKSYPGRLAKWEQAKAERDAQIKKWLTENPGKTAKDAPAKKLPRKPYDPATNPWRPASLYNAMIHPLAPYTVKGAIWYQGESNWRNPNEYQYILPALINDWRKLWDQKEFHFGIVQLANFRGIDKEPKDPAWAHIRDAQLKTAQTLPNAGIAVIIDIGEARDIHPKNKQDVGKRLALWAQHDVYQTIDSNWIGPVFETFNVDGNKIKLTFKHVDDKLTTRDGKAPAELIICGEDKKWVWANARITGSNTIEVWADGITKPVAVRYAWANNPANPNLTDASNLPASPFRTDDWQQK
ncbi:MAG: sialate O-acetylesterase, partial [Phycisphaeraceae bacterium JB051]